MHSKRKGNIGQLATAFNFSKHQFSVFSELGDISKIDLIVEKNGTLLKIQCKSTIPKNDVLRLPLRKCGPNYTYQYKKEDCDYFSLYDITNNALYLINSNILDTVSQDLSLRIGPPKNNQTACIRYAHNYEFEKIIEEEIIPLIPSSTTSGLPTENILHNSAD